MATVTKGKYASVETIVYGYLREELGFNTAIACGILANIAEESGFNPAAVGDNGDAYGLCQWNSRRESLMRYCSSAGLDYKTTVGQLAFLNHELQTTESRAMDQIKNIQDTAQGAYDAGERFCIHFERPSNSESRGRVRGALARDTYWKHYSVSSNDTEARVTTLNLGQRIVREARKHIGKPWSSGGAGPDNFDDLGLIRYCYSQVGINIPNSSRYTFGRGYLPNIAKRVYPISNVAAGDILVYTRSLADRTVEVAALAIATGDGGLIYSLDTASSSVGGAVVEVTDISDPQIYTNIAPTIYRIVADAQTSQGPLPTLSSGTTNYWSVASNDPYANVVAENLSRVQSEGFRDGYLIDMTHGGVFKFYVPEFEESAGANWDSIEIIGRSVSILSYRSTSSRTIQVSLDLYAGVGMYDVSDPVGKLHADANFLKSLEYPDYTNPITRPPATVHLILGAAVNLVGVVSNVVVNHMKPVDAQNRSMYLKVSFTVTQVAVNPPDYTDVYRGQYAIAGTDNIDSLLLGGETPIGQENTNAPVFSN